MNSERPNSQHTESAEQTEEKQTRMAPEQPIVPKISSNASTEPTFPRFKELPIELRHEIWKSAISSRIVHIYERPIREPRPPLSSLHFRGQSSSQEQRRQYGGGLDWETAAHLARERAEQKGHSLSWSDPEPWLWQLSREGISVPDDDEDGDFRLDKGVLRGKGGNGGADDYRV